MTGLVFELRVTLSIGCIAKHRRYEMSICLSVCLFVCVCGLYNTYYTIYGYCIVFLFCYICNFKCVLYVQSQMCHSLSFIGSYPYAHASF